MSLSPATLAAFALLLALCFGARIILRSWIAPPAFCAVYWLIFIAINLCFPEYPVLAGGLLYLAAVSAVFTLGHYFAHRALLARRTQPWPEKRPSPKVSSTLFRTALVLQVAGGLAYTGILRRMGIQQIENISWLIQLLLISHFIGPILAGLLLGGGMLRPSDRLLSLLALAPALTISILYTGRTAFIGPALIMATGYLAGTVVYRPRETPLFSFTRLVLVVCAFAATVLYGTGIYMLRIARGTGGSVDTLQAASLSDAFGSSRWQESYQSIRTSVFGQPSAFTVMLRDHYGSADFVPRHGHFIFAGPFVLLGQERPLHANYRGPDGVETNVYTVFAPALDDFGVAGSLFWWGFVGAISALAWRFAQAGRITGAAVLAIILINLQIGSGFLFRYNSVIGAYVLTLVACGWLDRQRARQLASAVTEPASPARLALAPELPPA